MSVLVCGSVAYDTLLNFEGEFSDQILPDQLCKLSTTFKVPTMRRDFGGCAGNIAYNLNLLGVKPVIMASVGDDFEPYRMHLRHQDISDSHIHRAKGQFTSQCFIISDRKGNQLTAFHPGAMDYGTENHISDLQDSITLAIVAPCGYQPFLQHCQELFDAQIPFIFDPSQELPLFSCNELKQMINQAAWLALNDYEIELMRERTGWGIDVLRHQVEALIVTRGSHGSDIYTADSMVHIPRAHMESQPIDPAGCGDAYRAGIIYGILNHWDWEQSGRLANLLGAIKVTSPGPQNHHFTWDNLADLYHKSYGEDLIVEIA
jgi:adenosine kinase